MHIIELIEVFDCHNFEARCHICLTDSDGIQEKSPSYGRQIFVMCDTTKRPKGVDVGTLRGEQIAEIDYRLEELQWELLMGAFMDGRRKRIDWRWNLNQDWE